MKNYNLIGLLIFVANVLATQWTGTYAEALNVPVTYPYKIHTGKFKGRTKYTSGPADLNTGDLVRQELLSRITFDQKWVLRHQLGNSFLDLAFDEDFLRDVFGIDTEVRYLSSEIEVGNAEEAVDDEVVILVFASALKEARASSFQLVNP